MHRILFILLALTLPALASAQEHRISGRVLDGDGNEGLPGANVVATSLADSTLRAGTSTDRRGLFRLSVDWTGPTSVRVSHLGFRPYEDTIDVQGDGDFGVVTLQPEVLDMEGVEVRARRERMTIRGDTIEFFAGGFFVPRYTYAESLVEALPGFEIRGGEVFYLGQPVDRVLVDGRAYFGKDVMEALLTMPIEMIESLQIYEQLPENRRFSGVDDGSREQVINLVTDPAKRNAVIVHTAAQGGTSDRYSGEMGLNQLNAPRQLRAGLSSGNADQPSRGGTARTHRGNLNYANTWNENTRVRLNYGVNDGLTRTSTELSRSWLGQEGSPEAYDEFRSSIADSRSHTVTGSFRHTIRGKHQLTVNPRLLVMRGDYTNALSGNSLDPITGTARLVTTDIGSGSESVTGGFSSDWQYNSGDGPIGLLANFNMSFSDDLSESFQSSSFDPASSFLSVTESETESGSLSLDGSVGMMRRIGERGYMSLGVDHSRSNRVEDRSSLTTAEDGIAYLDSTLSNDYDGLTRSSGLNAHFGFYGEKRGFDLSLVGRRERRIYEQTFPFPDRVDQTDHIVNASINGTQNLAWGSVRTGYSISGSPPPGDELQRVVDNSNPLFLSVGNPDLATTFRHAFDGRLNLRKPESNTSLGMRARMEFTSDVLGTELWYAGSEDREVLGVLVPAGGQLTRRANLGTQREFSLNGNLSRMLGLWRYGTATLEFGISASARPVSIDGQRIDSGSRIVSLVASLGGQQTERMAIRGSYELRRSVVNSRMDTRVATDYLSHNAGLTLNASWSSIGLTLASNLGLSAHERLGSDFDSRSVNWSVTSSWRPRFAEQLVATVTLNDLLDDGDNLQRTSSNLYLESSRSNRLGRHALFSLRWEFRAFSPGGSD